LSIFKIKLRRTDKLFSQYIRRRDNFTCQRCHHIFPPDDAQGLHNSHYWGRGHENTRMDSDNCIALCFGCHRIWAEEERAQYKAFMIERLGQIGYDLLEYRHNLYKKRDDKADLIILKYMLEELKEV
jgi:hypothetical protein